MKVSLPAVLLLILGVFLIVAPWTITPVCEVGGMFAELKTGKTLPMPCGWTARAEIGMGILLIVAGALLLFAQTAEAKRMIGIFGVVLGILVILFPLYITKTCMLADHPCNTLTKPVLILVGIIAIAVSAWVAYSSKKD